MGGGWCGLDSLAYNMAVVYTVMNFRLERGGGICWEGDSLLASEKVLPPEASTF
jgi:hypothetical protein